MQQSHQRAELVSPEGSPWGGLVSAGQGLRRGTFPTPIRGCDGKAGGGAPWLSA